MPDQTVLPFLERIAEALERLSPKPTDETLPNNINAFVWNSEGYSLKPVTNVSSVELSLLRGIDQVRDILLENTRRFAKGFPANNALLWGARGMGKSSLIKAVHYELNMDRPGSLVLVEIHREDISSFPTLLQRLTVSERRCLIFCDDLSFDDRDSSYKSLKAVLEGGIEGRPENVIFYATSNRRHLMPRDMIDNEKSTAINPGESVEEKVSLSDRFGLWLGFHTCSQKEYLSMVDGYVKHYEIQIATDKLHSRAHEWALSRGSRSGRVAWQFIQDLAGDLKVRL